MNCDTKTTLWGLVGAVAIAAFGIIQFGVDYTNPAWWSLIVAAMAKAAHGFYTNKEK